MQKKSSTMIKNENTRKQSRIILQKCERMFHMTMVECQRISGSVRANRLGAPLVAALL